MVLFMQDVKKIAMEESTPCGKYRRQALINSLQYRNGKCLGPTWAGQDQVTWGSSPEAFRALSLGTVLAI